MFECMIPFTLLALMAAVFPAWFFRIYLMSLKGREIEAGIVPTHSLLKMATRVWAGPKARNFI